MSFVVLWRSKDTGDVSVLDTADLTVETVSGDAVNHAKYEGLDVVNYNKTHSIFGISTDKNSYELFIHDYPNAIYKGEFPSSCDRGDLFDHTIKVTDFGMVDNHLCILITCECWCKYDIELPMVMMQLLKLPLKSLSEGSVSVYTARPLNFVTKSVAKRQCIQCNGDYPRYSSVEQGTLYENCLEDTLRVFGVEYGSKLPSNMDICGSMKFIKLSD